jgi:hypothetical protein
MKNANHYLITVTAGQDMHLHGYLAFRNGLAEADHLVDRSIEKMLAAADSKGVTYLPVILVTKLDSCARTVREVCFKLHPEARERHEKATDVCLAAWFMLANSPDDLKLMALH